MADAAATRALAQRESARARDTQACKLESDRDASIWVAVVRDGLLPSQQRHGSLKLVLLLEHESSAAKGLRRWMV